MWITLWPWKFRYYSIHHTAIWAQIAIPPWSSLSPHPKLDQGLKGKLPQVLCTNWSWCQLHYLVFEWGSIKATLFWCKQFQDLIELKNLDAAAKFTNANILTSSAGCNKWQQAWAKVLGNPPANETNARFNRVMLIFIQKCGATSETAKDFVTLSWMLRIKPSNLCFEDFKQQLKELNDYLPYLLGPLNQHLGDDQLFMTHKKCVPAWQKKYTDSNAHKNIDNVNDLADYYGDLENQEKKECNQDNQHRNRNSSQGQNCSQQRNCSQCSNESHYIEQNNGNSDSQGNHRNSRGRSSDNYHQGQGNQDRNRDNNRQDQHQQGNQKQDNSNSQCRYNTL